MFVLVVEDDFQLNEMLKKVLLKEGYDVETAFSGTEALLLLENRMIDLVVLDLMLPGVSGEKVLDKIKEKMDIPIIILSAKSEIDSKVDLIKRGADDYITKPFNILELKARIKAILRRSVRVVTHEESKSNIIKSRDLEIDLESRRCFIKGKEKNLTAKEFDLLELFMKNPGKVYSRDNLLTTIWGAGYPGDVRAVDVHVRRLREKIEAVPSEPEYIHTKWGVGYYFQ